MSEYRHGAYADPEASRDYVSPPGIGTIPVYVGRAPVHQLADYAGRKDVPLLINSYNDAIQQIGYSDDWENYELSEAVYAHFKYSSASAGRRFGQARRFCLPWRSPTRPPMWTTLRFTLPMA